MNREIELQNMTKQHLKQVLALEKHCFTMPWSKKGFLDGMKLPDNLFLVAMDGGTLAGYGSLYVVADQAELVNIAVAEPYRRQGVAGAILDAMLAHCKTHGVARMFLEVRVSNHPAIRLYEKKGFVPAGIRPGFYVKPREDAMVMAADMISH